MVHEVDPKLEVAIQLAKGGEAPAKGHRTLPHYST